jgi:hypothetical protein
MEWVEYQRHVFELGGGAVFGVFLERYPLAPNAEVAEARRSQRKAKKKLFDTLVEHATLAPVCERGVERSSAAQAGLEPIF